MHSGTSRAPRRAFLATAQTHGQHRAGAAGRPSRRPNAPSIQIATQSVTETRGHRPTADFDPDTRSWLTGVMGGSQWV